MAGKLELATVLAEKHNITVKDSRAFLESMVSEIVRLVKNGDTVVIKKFGSFRGKSVKGRDYTLKCGVVTVKEHRKMSFRAIAKI